MMIWKNFPHPTSILLGILIGWAVFTVLSGCAVLGVLNTESSYVGSWRCEDPESAIVLNEDGTFGWVSGSDSTGTRISGTYIAGDEMMAFIVSPPSIDTFSLRYRMDGPDALILGVPPDTVRYERR